MNPQKPSRQAKTYEKEPSRLKQVVFKGRGLSPEFKNANWRKIRDAAYGFETGAMKHT